MLHIVGDVNLTEGAFDVGIGIGSRLKQGLDPFKNLERKAEDRWIGNFEGVASNMSFNKGTAAQMFRTEPSLIKKLHHLDYYGVANNHVMEHGGEAYRETLNTIEASVSEYFGSIEKKSLIFEHQGKKVSLTAFSMRPDYFKDEPQYWLLPENCEIEQELKQVKEKGANFHIAFIHGGIEFIDYPYNDQKTFYRSIIDMGYNMVIGMHPHVLQGYEIWHGKYIFYSLGNFEFNMAWNKTKYGAIVNVDVSGDNPAVFYDYVKIGDDLVPALVEEKDVPEDCRFESLNKLLAINKENEIYFSHANETLKEYQSANRKWFLKNLSKMPKHVVLEMITSFIRRRL